LIPQPFDHRNNWILFDLANEIRHSGANGTKLNSAASASNARLGQRYRRRR
jgi:hypothetical protein